MDSSILTALVRISRAYRWRSATIGVLILILISRPQLAFAADTIIHSFAGPPNDGYSPSGLTLVGNVFYGVTGYGGPNSGQGVLYRINPDGTGYTILHTFHGGSTDAARPVGRLIVDGSNVYGVSKNGGTNNFGTIYSMDLTNGNVTVLHSFAGGTNDGEFPCASIVLIDSTLYGSAELGGPDNLGVVFKINTNGTGFGILHPFATGTSDGHLPLGGLTLVGSTLFGTTAQGGSRSNGGTLFKIDADGSNYAILHAFGVVTGDGWNVEEDLTLVGTTFYGVTNQGGSAGTGTIFKIETSGTGYAVLYSFEGTSGNDGHPSSPLLTIGNRLIGTTDPIDNTIPDLVYSIKNDGSDFEVLYKFNGPTTEGREPGGNLYVIGQNLFGGAIYGGTIPNVNDGVIYSLPLPFSIISVSRSETGQFSLTGETWRDCPVTIQVFASLGADPLASYPITSDSTGTFHFEDPAAPDSPRFYRATMP